MSIQIIFARKSFSAVMAFLQITVTFATLVAEEVDHLFPIFALN